MKSFLVFLRILIVGCLWGIVFTEGIRVIMLCNWHFDIFWSDHWRQFGRMWSAGWTPHAAKEWAFILLIITFIPMLITGWWTLSIVAWEEIIWKIITYPYRLYLRLSGKSTEAPTTANNRYGIVKRKSYKQVRPLGVSGLREPISDYGTSTISSPMPASSAALAGSSYANSSYATPTIPIVKDNKKTDVGATIDHALFKFDDDDEDDFDLDIDSFEKTEINKKKDEDTAPKSAKKYDYDDEEDFADSIKTTPKRRKVEDDDEDEAKPARRESKRTTRKSDEKEKRTSRTRNSEDTEKSSTSRTRRSNKTEDKAASAEHTSVSEGENNTATHHAPVYDALDKKGYDIISNTTVNGTLIDFIGVSEDEICCCLVDKESGDWLADEEMFNGEEPLWFSENSHRISPVCKLNNAKKVITDKLEDAGFEQKLNFFVVVQMANIINADDMFEVWENMDIEVTRINRGAPKEIKLFSKELNEAKEKMPEKDFAKLQNLLKKIA